METNRFAKLHTNQRLLLEELVRRGVEITVLVPELELVEARLGSHQEMILDRDGSSMPYASCLIAADKYLTKKLLSRAGLEVPEGEQFFPDQLNDAMRYGESLGWPVIVKPSRGSHGDGCITDIEDGDSLREAFDTIAMMIGKNGLLIEKQRPGMEFRVFITRNGDFAVLHRDPASVVGDGQRTIAELAEAETKKRASPRTNCLCPILLDRQVEDFLKRAGRTLRSIPKRGERIYLRRNSNVAHGGNCEDYTDRAHESVVLIAKRALAAITALPYAGVDILSVDITKPQTKGSYCILEVNSNPGIHMHERPGKGLGRSVAAYVADMIFPETKKR